MALIIGEHEGGQGIQLSHALARIEPIGRQKQSKSVWATKN